MFGKFFNYGCHCFPGGIDGLYDARDRKRPTVHAKPVDQGTVHRLRTGSEECLTGS